MSSIGRDLRIGIIGGGPSGLATAHALREHGFTNVVVLERESEAGGKCLTFWHRGRSYELGAAIVTPAYRQTLRLASQYGISAKLCLGAAYVDAQRGRVHRVPYLPPSVGLRGALGLPAETARLFALGLFERMRQFPRLDQADPSLAEPFEPWCKRQGLSNMLEVIRPWATSFGYGHMDEVPAAYMLNYTCLLGPSYEFQDVGFRGLWQRVAKDLDVRCNMRVTRVERGTKVQVHTERQAFEFDTLVLACPLEAALEFLDVSAEERDLCTQVRYTDYQVVAAEVSGMPKWRYMFAPDNFKREASDKPMFYYRRYPDSDLINFYSFRGADGLEGAEREAIRFAERMGGRVHSIVAKRPWRYFPHVSSASMEAGFHARFEALQGQRQTYYASEVLSFSCVEPVVSFANDLVRRHFATAVETAPGWLGATPENSQEAGLAKTG